MGLTRFRCLLAGIIAALVLADFAALSFLADRDLLERLVPVSDLGTVGPSYAESGNVDLPQGFNSSDPFQLLKTVMNSVGKIGKSPAMELPELYQYAAQGGGLLCSGMAEYYLYVLRRNGIKARLVILRRDILSIYDSHASVEIFTNKHWVLADPTFHAVFRNGEELLCAQDVKSALLDGSVNQIEAEFLGEVTYPARLDSYYMDWRPLFNNVVVLDKGGPEWFKKLPPLRYWQGPVGYYEGSGDTSEEHLEVLNRIYFLVSAAIPMLLIFLGSVLTCSFLYPMARRLRTAPINAAEEDACP